MKNEREIKKSLGKELKARIIGTVYFDPKVEKMGFKGCLGECKAKEDVKKLLNHLEEILIKYETKK